MLLNVKSACFLLGASLLASAVSPVALAQDARVFDYRSPRQSNGVRLMAAKTLDEGELARTDLPAAEAPATEGSLAVGDELTFVLFDDVKVTLTLKEQTPTPLGGEAFLAESSGYEGVKNAVVIRTADGFQVDVRDCKTGVSYIVSSSSSGVVVRAVKPTEKPRTCGAECLPAVTNAVRATPQIMQSVSVPLADSFTPAYVDILVAYDTRAADWAKANGGGVSNFAETQVQKMNTAIANTGLDSSFRFRLVGVYEVGGDAGGGLSAALQMAMLGGTLNGHSWAGVSAKRDEVEADIVCVLIDNGTDTGTTGIGYSLKSDSGDFSGSAYNACLIRAVASSHTMTHEVGHNMGAGHSDAMADKSNCGPQYYSYSSGYYFSAAGEKYHTVMGYNTDGHDNYYTEVPYFSSPDHTYKGVAVGDAKHNNSLTLKNLFLQTSRYRGWVVAADDVGAAIGCSDHSWETGGNYPWQVISDASTVGATAARSCEMLYATTSWLRTQVTGPTILSFDYMLRTYGGSFVVTCDSAELFIRRNEAIPSMDWKTESVSIPVGKHTLTFSYTHPSSGYTTGWGNGVRLDNVRLGDSPEEEPTVYRTVSFDANGGAVDTPTRQVESGNPVGELPVPTRLGYELVGWYTAKVGGSIVEAGRTITADVTFFARWKAISYEIEYVLAGGTNPPENPVTYTVEDAVSLKNPTRPGYTFDGWTPNNGVIAKGSTGNRTFTANWSVVPVTPADGTYNEIVDGIAWTYVISDGKASVGSGRHDATAVPTSTSGSIVIPSVLGGCPVTSIGEWAFYICSGLTSVTVPEGVTSIGDSAFGSCSGLTSVTIPTSVTSIGAWAFSYCSGLGKGVVIVDGCVLTVNGECPNSVDLPTGVRLIGGGAFSDCSGLTSVTIPEGVTSIGQVAFCYCSGLTSVNIPSSVTSIGDGAFFGCSRLGEGVVIVDGCVLTVNGECPDSVDLPTGVRLIGGSAFFGCSGLTSVTIPTGVTSIGCGAFAGCSGLASVTIPSSVTSIGEYVFYDCSGLTSVTIPSSVTSIGDDAFENCSGLKTVYVEVGDADRVRALVADSGADTSSITFEEKSVDPTPEEQPKPDGGPYAEVVDGIAWTYVISDGEASVGSGWDATAVPTSTSGAIVIPSVLGGCPVTSIGDYAFSICSGLTSVTIPEGVASIGDYAFSGCSGLTSVTIPEGVASIGDYAFSICSGLTSVTIPSSVTSIGYCAFCYCGSMISFAVEKGNSNYKSENGLLLTKDGIELIAGVNGDVTIPSSVTSIRNMAFSGCDGLTSVTIPEGVTSIGGGAFSGCSGLTSVTIPTSVTSIGAWAFSGCSGLGDGVVIVDGCVLTVNGECPNSVDLQTGVRLIGGGAFYGCSGLTSVTIPEGVTSIGCGAFAGCSGLTSVTIPSSVTSIEDSAFSGCSGLGDGVVIVDGCVLTVNGECPNSVDLPTGVRLIGGGVFYGCDGLTSVTIPSSVTSIGGGAFEDCDGLKTVYVEPGDASRVKMLYDWNEDVDFVETPPPTKQKYIVTFELGSHGTWTGGELTQSVEDGTAAVEPAFAVEEGWEFTGWDKTFDKVTSDLTVTAQYKQSENSGDITPSPDWTPVTQPDTLIGYFVVSNAATGALVESDGSLLGAFTASGECRGVARPTEGPRGKLFQITVGIASSTEKGIVLKVFDKTTETTTDLSRTIDAGVEKYGSIIAPEVLTFGVPPVLRHTVVFDLGARGTWAGGGELTQSVEDGTAAVEPAFAVEEGWEFTGWDKTFDKVTSDLTVTAQWQEALLPDLDPWTSDFSAAREKADAEGAPLVVVWSNPGCAHCDLLAEAVQTPAVEAWLSEAGVISCWSVGDAEAKAFARNASGEFPYVAVYWNREGHDPDKVLFTGRHGRMLTLDGDLAAQFTASVELALLQIEGKVRTVSFDQNVDGIGISVSERYYKDGTKLGTLPTAERHGYDFLGWFTAAEGGEPVSAETVVTGDMTFFAQWSLIVKPDDPEDPEEPEEDVCVTQVGVKTLVELGDDFAGCKATGLPAGLKFAAKDVKDKDFGEILAGTVYGVPTKAVTNDVVFTRKEGKETLASSVTFAVAAIPAWAVGTFNGRIDNGAGSATLTVAANGKISGKVITGGKTWSFSSAGYEMPDRGEDGEVSELQVVATAKSGKLAAEVSLSVGCDGVTGFIAGEDIDSSLTLWRNEWKDKGATDKLKAYVGLYTVQLVGDGVGTGYLSLTVDAKGTCKATGKLPDGTSASGTLPLVWNDADDALMAIWQMAPSAYKGGHVGGLLKWESGGQVSGEEIAWVSRSPTATEEYGAGFERALSANGAYYDKLATLPGYYKTLSFVAESPALVATVKTTDYDDYGKKATVSEQSWIDAVDLACWGALTVSLDAKGTAFVVDQGKATKPVQDKTTKEWSYEGANDAALTVSFAKATGIFKGTFTCWYDYVSATDSTKEPAKETQTHTSKKVSYEGVMVLGEPLRGFYLWDRTGAYEDEKTGKEKTFKYKESRPVVFE